MKKAISKPLSKVNGSAKKKVEKHTTDTMLTVAKATKKPLQAKTKSNTKKVEKPTTDAKQPVVRAAKKSLTAKTKSNAKKVEKPTTDAKQPVVRAAKKSLKAKAKISAQKSTDTPAKQPVFTRIVTHGKDHHFIPVHKADEIANAHDSIKEEKLFHNKEEVALHQENQKVKVSIVSQANKKRIFNSQGRR